MSKLKQSIAILGGSFDPVHNGHVALGAAAQKYLELDQLIVLPAKRPPHKLGLNTDENDRLSMLELAFGDLPNVFVDKRELKRARTSYTVLSMREMRAELGKDVSLNFIMGWDSFRSLDTWWQWQDLLGLLNIVVAARPGYSDIESQQLADIYSKCLVKIEDLTKYAAGKVAMLPFDELDVSSSDIRDQLKARGRNRRDTALGASTSSSQQALSENVSLSVPTCVANYIDRHNLYN